MGAGTRRRPRPLDELDGLRVLVWGEVVHDHDVAGPQRRDEHPADVGAEDLGVCRPLYGHAGRGTIEAHRGDHRRRAPVAVGAGEAQPGPARASPPQPCHVGLGRRLVQEHQPGGIYAALPAPPERTRFGDIGAILLAGMESLFLYVSPMSSRT